MRNAIIRQLATDESRMGERKQATRRLVNGQVLDSEKIKNIHYFLNMAHGYNLI